MMDSPESEDESEKKKLEEMSESKSTRPCDDLMFLRREIIDAITRSDEKMETYSKTDEKMDKFGEKWRITKREQMKRWTHFYRQLTIESEPSSME